MSMTFDNVAISVTDVDAAATWYAALFGFRPGYRTVLDDLEADFLVLERDDLRIELISRRGVRRHEDASVEPPDHLNKTNIMAVVFRTDDLGAETRRMEKAADTTFVWKELVLSADGLRSTMLRDPDGNLINVLQYPA